MECLLTIAFIECNFYQGSGVVHGFQERMGCLPYRFPGSKLDREFAYFLVLRKPWSLTENEFGHLKCCCKMVFRQVVVFQPFCRNGMPFLLSLFIHHTFNCDVLSILNKEVCKLHQLPTINLACIMN